MSAKEHKKVLTVLGDRDTGKPLMTVELFIKICLKYNFLTRDEALTAITSGCLPRDFPKRLRLYEIERNKN